MPVCKKCGEFYKVNFVDWCNENYCKKCFDQQTVSQPGKAAKPFAIETILCPECQSENSCTFTTCSVCGTLLKKQPLAPSQATTGKGTDKSGDDSKFSTSYGYFNTLKGLGQFLQFLGVLSFVIGIIFLFKIFAGNGGSDAALMGLGMLTAILPIAAIVGGLLLFLAGLFFVVQAESGLVLLEIEKNTRQMTRQERA